MSKEKRWGKGTRFTDADKGKEILLRVAIECLVQRGIKHTTVEQVAAAANVSRRTVYRYFTHKEHMMEEVFAYGRRLVFEELKTAAAPYSKDFPRYFEECVVGAVKFYETIASTGDGKDLVSRNNLQDAQRYVTDEETRKSWWRLLRQPYLRYIETVDHADGERTLDEFIDLAHMLVIGHRNLRSSEMAIRKSVRNLRLAPVRSAETQY